MNYHPRNGLRVLPPVYGPCLPHTGNYSTISGVVPGQPGGRTLPTFTFARIDTDDSDDEPRTRPRPTRSWNRSVGKYRSVERKGSDQARWVSVPDLDRVLRRLSPRNSRLGFPRGVSSRPFCGGPVSSSWSPSLESTVVVSVKLTRLKVRSLSTRNLPVRV